MAAGSDEELRSRLRRIVETFGEAMLVTRAPDGGLRSRPLAIAACRATLDLYFATHVDSGKIEEIEADPRVNVAMQSRRRFVSITGRARVEHDRALVERLWSARWRLWFPRGKEDPRLCLLHVEPEEAEYWDRSGGRRLRFLFGAARALLARTTPAPDRGQNAKVVLHRAR